MRVKRTSRDRGPSVLALCMCLLCSTFLSEWTCRNLHPFHSYDSTHDVCSGAPAHSTGLCWCGVTDISYHLRWFIVCPANAGDLQMITVDFRGAKAVESEGPKVETIFLDVLLWENS